MCAIVDANIAHEVFGRNRPQAGEKFFNWLNQGGRLIVGGQLIDELLRSSPNLREWAAEAQRRGILIYVDDNKVNARTDILKRDHVCLSDDPHVIALAQVGGARLLYSNDQKLRDDFKDSDLIDPPGRIYSTLRSKTFGRTHRELLRTNDCNVSV